MWGFTKVCSPLPVLFFYASSFLLTICPAAAQELYAAEIRPSAFKEEGINKGYSIDIAKEVVRRLGNSNTEVELLPFRRAFFQPRNNPNTVLANLARIKGRERHFKWLYKITDVVSFYVTRRKGISHTHETASALNLIGVLSGAAIHTVLKKNTQANIHASPNEETNLKMLMAGRIDAWFTSNVLMRGALLNLPNVTREDLVVGEKIGDVIGIYAVGSLDMSSADILKWQQAFASMKKDGTYQAIMDRYLAPITIPSE